MKIRTSSNTDQSLYHDCLFLLGLGVTDTTTYPTNDFIRSANEWNRKAVTWIWQSQGDWDYDDSNYTDLPIATTTLVDGQQDYALPSTAFEIERVEILDKDGEYVLISPIDKTWVKDESMTEFEGTNGMPKYYDLVANSIFLYPAPSTDDVTAVAGIKIYFRRGIDTFSITDTATTPGFQENFHRICSVGPAMDWCNSKMIVDRIPMLNGMMKDLMTDVKQYYSTRHKDYPSKILVSRPDFI